MDVSRLICGCVTKCLNEISHTHTTFSGTCALMHCDVTRLLGKFSLLGLDVAHLSFRLECVGHRLVSSARVLTTQTPHWMNS